jgi:nicotinate phosphoribosyltransferase
MNQIVTNFSDQDLYSWSVGLFWLNHFPELRLEYKFIDRNETIYPEGFADRLMEQVQGLDGLKMTPEEIGGLKYFTHSYFPSWYYVFLQGLELRAYEVKFWQDEAGHLEGKIEGPAWRVVFWEQILLATISEMWHTERGDNPRYYLNAEAAYARLKAARLIAAGCNFSDMGTRRRFSKEHHLTILKEACEAQEEHNRHSQRPGAFVGTSNLMYAIQLKKSGYPWIKCIGTMSHQVISVCAAIYGPREANKIAMTKWYESYKGNLGIYLPDCLGTDAFYLNFSKENAKLYDGIRIDSGDNISELEKALEAYQKLGVDPGQKSIVFSNGLNIDTAIDIHKGVAGRMKDSYGLGTVLTCDLADKTIPASNIVIKAVGCQLTVNTPKVPCVKISCDPGKATGDKETIEAYLTLLKK